MAPTIISRLFRCLATAMAVFCLPVAGLAQAPAGLNWFRSDVQDGTASAWYRWAVDPAVANSESAELTIVTDGHCSLYVNGQRILKNVSLRQSGGSVTALGFDVKSLLRQGRNTVAVEVHSADKAALFGIAIQAVQGEKRTPQWAAYGKWHPSHHQSAGSRRISMTATGPKPNRSPANQEIASPSQHRRSLRHRSCRRKFARTPFQFEDGDHVVFVGATFFERAQLSEHLEATLAGTCRRQARDVSKSRLERGHRVRRFTRHL